MVRHRLAVVVLAVIAVASSVWWLLDLVGEYSRNAGTFGVEAFDSRFANMRKTVTPDTVLGYFSDNPDKSTVNQAEYYLTQYALAPALVIAPSNEPLVVGNTHQPTVNVAVLQANHLALVQDFGSGVILCRIVRP